MRGAFVVVALEDPPAPPPPSPVGLVCVQAMPARRGALPVCPGGGTSLRRRAAFHIHVQRSRRWVAVATGQSGISSCVLALRVSFAERPSRRAAAILHVVGTTGYHPALGTALGTKPAQRAPSTKLDRPPQTRGIGVARGPCFPFASRRSAVGSRLAPSAKCLHMGHFSLWRGTGRAHGRALLAPERVTRLVSRC